MTQILNLDTEFNPCPVQNGDELFPNGIFEYNVSRMLDYLENNPADVELVEVTLSEIYPEFSSVDEPHLQSVDISKPLVLAEIAPGKFNLLDGHHRVEKARRLGVKKMQAYKLTVLQHIAFLTSKRAYLAYVEYWNSKVKGARQQEKSNKSPR